MFEIRLDCSPWAAPPPHSDLGDRSNIIHYIPQPLGHPLKVQCYSQNCAFSISLVQPCRIRERGWSVGSDIKNSVSFNCTQSMLGARRHVHTLAEGGCFVRVCVCVLDGSLDGQRARNRYHHRIQRSQNILHRTLWTLW